MAEPAKPEVAFDTLQTAEDLKSAGMDERHAKAIATAMRDAIASGTVTRTDLAEFKGETKADFVGVKIWLMVITVAFLTTAIIERFF